MATVDHMGGDALLTLHEASRVSGLPVEVLYGLVVRGQLKGEHDGDSQRWLIARSELDRYLNQDG